MAACTARMTVLALPVIPPLSKGLGTYGRVQRFLDGHYAELLPEFLILGALVIAGFVKLA